LALGGWGGGGRGQDLGLGWILMGIHGILRGIVMGIYGGFWDFGVIL